MSDKTPHWPGADGKPGVNFGPKSLPENKDGKPTTADPGQKPSSTPPRPDTEAARENAPQATAAATGQPGQELAVPGRNTKQVNRTGDKPDKSSSGSGKPQQSDKKPAAVGAKNAPQALPGPVAGDGRDEKPSTPASTKQTTSDGKPTQKGPRPMPRQARPALPGSQTQAAKSGKSPAGQAPAPQGQQQPQAAAGTRQATAAASSAAGAAAAAGAGAAAASAKAAPWAATPASGGRSTARDKSHKPEGTLSKVGEARRTRKARLRISRVDPWSVMKTTFLFSIAFGIMLVIIVAVLWGVIAGSGALQSINSTMTQLIGDSGTQFNIEDYINAGRVIGFAAVLAALDVVIITAVSTLFAFLYNLAAAVIGGLEVTLAED